VKSVVCKQRFCKHSHETSGCLKNVDTLDYLSENVLLKNCSPRNLVTYEVVTKLNSVELIPLEKLFVE
jgi:hypothetical protein